MTLRVYITIDTEYRSGPVMNGDRVDWRGHFARSVLGQGRDGDSGILYQMDVMDRHGVTGVFYVDPMPALLWGVESIAAIVEPIVARGHDVQLHLHPEWLQWAQQPLVVYRTKMIGDYPLTEQIALIGQAKDWLMQAGAPAPVAFRAGNFGTGDDTMRALLHHNITYESSFGGGAPETPCHLSIDPARLTPTPHLGGIVVPVSAISDRGQRRHAQITALSATEMIAAIKHARDSGRQSFTIVSHSFELMSRDLTRTNRIVDRRFETLCAAIESLDGVESANFRLHPPSVEGMTGTLPPPHTIGLVRRMIGQVASNALYGSA